MLCPTCSTDIAAGSVFCPKCGLRLDEPAAAPAAASQPAKTPAELFRESKAAAASADASDVEQQLWQGSYSPKAMYGSWALAAVATVVALVLCVILPTAVTWFAAAVIVLVLWIVLVGYLLIQRTSVEYTLTNQRFIMKTGLLRRVTDRVDVIDIDDVSYEQGLFERMFNVGTIKLLSTDVTDPKLVLPGIEDVQRVATLIDNCRRQERRKRGIHIETV